MAWSFCDVVDLLPIDFLLPMGYVSELRAFNVSDYLSAIIHFIWPGLRGFLAEVSAIDGGSVGKSGVECSSRCKDPCFDGAVVHGTGGGLESSEVGVTLKLSCAAFACRSLHSKNTFNSQIYWHYSAYKRWSQFDNYQSLLQRKDKHLYISCYLHGRPPGGGAVYNTCWRRISFFRFRPKLLLITSFRQLVTSKSTALHLWLCRIVRTKSKCGIEGRAQVCSLTGLFILLFYFMSLYETAKTQRFILYQHRNRSQK